MLFDLTASDTSSPLSVGERDLAALAACERGTILLDAAVRADATLMTLAGSNGRITLSVRAGRLYGEQILGPNGSPKTGRGSRSASNVAFSTPRTLWAWTTAAPTRSP